MPPKAHKSKARLKSIFRGERYWIGLLGSFCKTLAVDLYLLIFSRMLSDFLCQDVNMLAVDFCFYGRYSDAVTVVNGQSSLILNKLISTTTNMYILIGASISFAVCFLLAPWLGGFWDRVLPKTRKQWMLLLLAAICIRASLFILLVFLKINTIWDWPPGVLLASPVIGNVFTAGQMLAGIAMTWAIACDFRPEHRSRLFYLNFFSMKLANLAPWPSDMNPTVYYLGWIALVFLLDGVGVFFQWAFVALSKKPKNRILKKSKKMPNVSSRKSYGPRLKHHQTGPSQVPNREPQQQPKKEESIEMVEFFKAENFRRCYSWTAREHFPDRRSQIMACIYFGLCMVMTFLNTLFSFDLKVRAQQSAFASVANSMDSTQTKITAGCMGVILAIWYIYHWCSSYWEPLPPPPPHQPDNANPDHGAKFSLKHCLYICALFLLCFILIGLRFYGYSIESFPLFYATSSLEAFLYLILAELLSALCDLITPARIGGAIGPLFFCENISAIILPLLMFLFLS